MVGYNENVLWKGRPDKKCFILESIFNPLLPFALLWLAFDSAFIITFTRVKAPREMLFVIPIFFLFHLMPVWIYIGGVLFSFRKYKNTEYLVTTKGIYVSGGVFTYTYEMKPFTDISHINVRRGIFDQWLGVGDVLSVCSHGSVSTSSNSHNHGNMGLQICDIPDYEYVFKLIKDLQTDVYADTMYPNDLRPAENHGYQTTYSGNAGKR